MAKTKTAPPPPFDIKALALELDKAAVSVLGEEGAMSRVKPLSWLSSGITLVDSAIHKEGKGIPSGRPLLFYGPSSSGKSLLGYLFGKMAQLMGGMFIIIDTEYFSYDLADLVGLDYDDDSPHFRDYKPETLEQLQDLLEKVYLTAKNSPVPIVVFTDSIAAIDALSNQDTVVQGAKYQQGKPNQLWSRFFKRVAVKRVSFSNLFLIFSTQVRLSFDFFNPGPPKEKPVGGYAIAHNMHIEVGCSVGNLYYEGSGTTDRSKAKDKTIVGQWVRLKATKNRCGPTHRPLGFPLYYSWGVDDVLANLEFLKEHGGEDFVREGSFYKWGEEKKYFKTWHKECLEDEELALKLQELTKYRYRQLYHQWDERRR